MNEAREIARMVSPSTAIPKKPSTTDGMAEGADEKHHGPGAEQGGDDDERQEDGGHVHAAFEGGHGMEVTHMSAGPLDGWLGIWARVL